MAIKINSKQCGSGKTTTDIYPLITNHLLNDEKVLLVVPSKGLQWQYAQQFQQHIKVINTDNAENVSTELHKALEDRHPFVCITHQALIHTRLDLLVKSSYHLIIDEAINPYALIKINLNSKWYPWKKDMFSEVFVFQEETHKNDTTWHPLYVNNPDPDNETPFFKDSKRWKELMNKNFQYYMQPINHNSVCTNEKVQMSLVQELNYTVLSDYQSVYIASASFESTFMYQWVKQYYDVVIEHEFVEHTTPINLHIPKNTFNWSKNLKNKYPDLLKQYHKYVNEHSTGEIITIRNNDELTTLRDETRLSHNVHGINDYWHLSNISLETALVPDEIFKHFYKQHLGMSDAEITTAYSAYLFYQIVLRSSIRDRNNNTPVNIFLLDIPAALELIDFFSDVNVLDNIDLTYTTKKRGRPKTGFNKKEYMRKYMQKRRSKK